jgi:hypothetical protein
MLTCMKRGIRNKLTYLLNSGWNVLPEANEQINISVALTSWKVAAPFGETFLEDHNTHANGRHVPVRR